MSLSFIYTKICKPIFHLFGQINWSGNLQLFIYGKFDLIELISCSDWCRAAQKYKCKNKYKDTLHMFYWSDWLTVSPDTKCVQVNKISVCSCSCLWSELKAFFLPCYHRPAHCGVTQLWHSHSDSYKNPSYGYISKGTREWMILMKC